MNSFNDIVGGLFTNTAQQVAGAANAATGLYLNNLLNGIDNANFGLTIDPNGVLTSTPLNAFTPEQAEQTRAENAAFSFQNNSTILIGGAAIAAAALIFIK